MEEEEDRRRSVSASSTSINFDFPSTSTSQSQVQGEDGGGQDNRRRDEHQDNWQHRRRAALSYRLSISMSSAAPTANMFDDLWPFLVVLVTFCFFVASVTLILGFYGPVNLPLGPNCSRLIQVNPLFVQSIKARELDDLLNGPMLYGFITTPPLDVEITWSEAHNVVLQSTNHKEWQYFLNEGSKVEISYRVKSPPSSLPLSLVIAQGKESLVEWMEYPSYPNSTLSWSLINGNGKIQQDISKSKTYYIALANLSFDDVEVQLNFTFKAFVHNTSEAYYNCSLNHGECNLNLFLSGKISAILTTLGPQQGVNNEWYVKLSYGPRWITYFLGSSIMSIVMVLIFRICSMFEITRGDLGRRQTQETGPERAPLLRQKDDDMSSWGSSYDSTSHDEEDLDKLLVAEEKKVKEGDENNFNGPQRLCVLCFDAPRDCFFLPCGHCTVCFTCGTRVIEEGGSCPICRRRMKKVRKIFTV